MLTDVRQCVRCNVPLTGDEPEQLCPACLLTAALSVNLAEFHIGDLPSDPCASFRPHTTVRLTKPEPTFGWALARKQFDKEGSAVPESPPKPPRATDSYRFLEMIGVGGSGEVWKAVQLSLGREVAVKRLHTRHLGGRTELSARMLNYFKHEAYITARLDHPNIVPIYDLGLDEQGHPLLAMKLVDGTSWLEILHRDQELPLHIRLEKHLPVLVELAQAVSFAHARGVLHRDLKPSQVAIGKFGEVLLMDWGLAVPYRRDTTGSIVFEADYVPNPAGTVAFMAPEQTRPTPEGLGPWTDVFQIGGILYYILTSMPPHPHRESGEAFASAAAGWIEPAEKRVAGEAIPGELSEICRRALRREPEERYASVEELAQALKDYLSRTNARQESSSLVRRAVDLLDEAVDDYMKLQASENLLSAALDIWPGNAEAGRLREMVIRQSAELALERSDLGVAATQVDRLGDATERTELAQQLAEKRRRQDRQGFQRRASILASAAFLLLAIIIGAYSWHASIRAAESTTEQRLSLHLAEQRVEQERKRTELLQATSRLRAEESRLSEQLTARLPYPSHLLFKDDTVSLLPEQLKEISKLMEAASGLERSRLELIRGGIPLEPEPFTLVTAKARLLISQASKATEALRAYDQAIQAAAVRPEIYSGRLLLGIAAARAEFYTSATKHLHDASVRARQTLPAGDPGLRDIFRLHEQAYALAQSEMPPDSTIIESCTHGRNSDYYQELSGNWLDSDSKSQAPGIGHYKLFKARLALPGTGIHTPVARFHLPVSSAGRYHVYSTWGTEANATSVSYTVQYATGTAELRLTQDGPGERTQLPWSGNSGLWVSLGAYDFTTTQPAYVEIRQEPDTTLCRLSAPQRICADAIAVTKTPIRAAIQLAVPFHPQKDSLETSATLASQPGPARRQEHHPGS